MPADSDSDPTPDLDATARRVLDDARKEPIPARLIRLAEQLEGLIAARDKPADPS